MPLLLLYRALTLFASPLVWLYLRWRTARGKEHPQRIGERFGHASKPRPPGKLFWLHAASVGEANSILPLLHALLQHFPQAHVLLTTGTVTSARLVEEKLPPRALHQFVPVDSWPAVRRFMHHWQPDAAIWTESELWPNLILRYHASGRPMALLNARMSPRSFRRWQRFSAVIHPLLQCFTQVFAQSETDATRYRTLGARQVFHLGNLKHDTPPLPVDENTLVSLQQQVGQRPLWVAASTHAGEESLIATAHELLAQHYPNLLTIIAPRHPARGDAIAQELRQRDLTLAQRSRQQPLTPQTAIYLADTLGELGLFYRIAPIVFMGGSLVPHGGQNPLEPARLGCALLCGPHTANFTDICNGLIQYQALTRIENADQLAASLQQLLQQPDQCRLQAQAAQQFALSQQGALKRILNVLLPALESTLQGKQ